MKTLRILTCLSVQLNLSLHRLTLQNVPVDFGLGNTKIRINRRLFFVVVAGSFNTPRPNVSR